MVVAPALAARDRHREEEGHAGQLATPAVAVLARTEAAQLSLTFAAAQSSGGYSVWIQWTSPVPITTFGLTSSCIRRPVSAFIHTEGESLIVASLPTGCSTA